MTLHSFEVNNRLATQVEAVITRDVTNYIKSDEFKTHLVDSHGSKTIKQEIYEMFQALLTGKPYTSPHSKKTPSISKAKLPVKNKASVVAPPQIRTTTGQFYSLASLQVLLDMHLQHVIASNMGSGSDRRILNYRTGRFAVSAKVERLSQSREGMITAFYTYMKYPYQTFEPGYAQGSPKSRDPKALISKSIKEIAATKVGNRMRAVLV